MKIKIALFCYGFNALGLFIFGLIYTLSPEFLPFHSEAIGKSWNELAPSYQVLYLGMMRTEGAGFMSSGIAIAILLAIPFRKREVWCYWAMAIIGIVEHVPSMIGAMNTSQLTPASSPWQLNLLGVVLLVVGLVMSLKSKT
ncbi:hypothetical protein [Ketobacter sp.]|uniref:hypothetical protein n=1 Tax=Ketobacter sp. TaxID=2083498 RepID=UPI0025C01786|nr:hypothetical protein [Ketobacter sp.]